MINISAKKRRKKNGLHGWLLWFALTAAFGLMGVSMAAYQGGLFISGTATTGECFVIITDPHLSVVSLADRGEDDSNNDDPDNQDNANKSVTHEVVIVAEEADQADNTEDDEIESKEPSLRASNSDDKSITVSIEDAYPGDVYRLQYTVVNEGTMPIELKLDSATDNPAIELGDSSGSSERLKELKENLGPGERSDEELRITVSKDADGGENYDFSIKLNYSQWKND